MFYAHDLSFIARPCVNRPHIIFCIFRVAKITAPPFSFGAPLLLALWGICHLCPLPTATGAVSFISGF